MPQIPIGLSERSIPGESGLALRPFEDTVGKAIQTAGTQVSQVSGSYLVEQVHQKKVKEDLKNNNLSHELLFDFKKGVSNIEKIIAQNPDMSEEDVEKQAIKLKESLFQNPKYSKPEVQNMALPALIGVHSSLTSSVSHLKTAQLVDRSKAVQETIVSEYTKAAAEASTPEERKLYVDLIEDEYKYRASKGVYFEHEIPPLMEKAKDAVAKTYFAQLGNTNPSQAFKELKDSKSEMTQILDPLDREKLIAHYNTVAKVQNADDLYSYLDTKFNVSGAPDRPKDLIGALRELSKPKLSIVEGGQPVDYDMKGKMTDRIKELLQIDEHLSAIDLKKKATTIIDTASKKPPRDAILFLQSVKQKADIEKDPGLADEANKEIRRIESELRSQQSLNMQSADYKEKQEYKKAINETSKHVKSDLVPQVASAIKVLMDKDPSLSASQAGSIISNDQLWMKKTKGLNLSPNTAVTPTSPTPQQGEKIVKNDKGERMILRTYPDGTKKWELLQGAK